MARGLEAAGADFLAIPCNNAHIYLPIIRAAVSIPVLDMIGLALDRLKAIRPRIRTIGVLASPGIRVGALLDERFEDAGISVRYPPGDGESELLEVIRAVKANRLDEGADWAYRDCALRLVETGVDALLVGCTELSVLGGLEKLETPVLDTLDALVSETVARCTGFRA
jgi:aspartate racemase